MTRPHLLAIALGVLAVLAVAPARAQTNDTPATEAFAHAIRAVCGPNVAGRLPFDLMNADLNTAHVVLVDASDDPDTLAAFHDWSGQPVEYGFVPAASGRINIGVDETLAWCRVAVLDVTSREIAAMKANLETLEDWGETGVVGPGVIQYLATLDGDFVFVRVADPAIAAGYGPAAGLVVTVMNPAAQED